MKKIMALLTSLTTLYLMSLPVLADIAADPAPARDEAKLLPFFFVIGIVVIAAVILIIVMRKKR